MQIIINSYKRRFLSRLLNRIRTIHIPCQSFFYTEAVSNYLCKIHCELLNIFATLQAGELEVYPCLFRDKHMDNRITARFMALLTEYWRFIEYFSHYLLLNNCLRSLSLWLAVIFFQPNHAFAVTSSSSNSGCLQ